MTGPQKLDIRYIPAWCTDNTVHYDPYRYWIPQLHITRRHTPLWLSHRWLETSQHEVQSIMTIRWFWVVWSMTISRQLVVTEWSIIFTYKSTVWVLFYVSNVCGSVGGGVHIYLSELKFFWGGLETENKTPYAPNNDVMLPDFSYVLRPHPDLTLTLMMSHKRWEGYNITWPVVVCHNLDGFVSYLRVNIDTYHTIVSYTISINVK
jgi:hypothetical protein